MPYPEQMCAPMRAELVDMGVKELRTAAEVDAFFADKQGTALILVNSVCGCAAGAARPGLQMALDNAARPDRVATVFAGQDLEATARARELIGDVPPSSPSLALLKDGELVHFVPRHMIEGHAPEGVAAQLKAGFDKYCAGA
jgi:putative YphP/YqiW family bacilliredoxin